MKQKDSTTDQFRTLLKMNNFVQLVKDETHVRGGLIDLIIQLINNYVVDTRLGQDDVATKVDTSYQTDNFDLIVHVESDESFKKNTVVSNM